MSAGAFYFAWTGGTVQPAPPVTTTGDTHGAIAQTFATTGDLIGGTLVENLADINGLVAGNLYGIADSEGLIPVGTTFVYLGGNSLSLSQSAAAPAASVTLVITAPVVVAQTTGSISDGSTTLNLDNTGALEVGSLYSVAGPGIPAGTLFAYQGGSQVTMSYPGQMTQSGVALLISGLVPNDPFTVDNVNTAGLVAGQQYLIVGPGIPAGTSFMAPGSGSALTLDQAATAAAVAVPLVMVGPLVPDAPFAPSVNLFNDEDIFSVDLSQNEGDFASLKIVVRNPRIGLLAAGRQIWCWLSWDSGAGIVQLFNGRLVGIPKALTGETVQLEFLACPNDYRAQKLAIATPMQVLPYWDPVWLTDRLYDPDTILETQPILWHTDRVSLVVTTSNINVGEDGTAVFREGDHFYQDLDVSYGQPPLTSVDVTGSVSWTQQGDGEIDITGDLCSAFATPASASWTGPVQNGEVPVEGSPPQGGYSFGSVGPISLTNQAIGGTYRVTFLSAGAAASLFPGVSYSPTGLFVVVDPRGQILGTAGVGAQFSGGGLSFTINEGTLPFVAGQQFLITVDTQGAGAGMGAANLIRTLTGDGLKSSWPKPGQSIGSGWSVGYGNAIDDVTGLLPAWLNIAYVPDSASAQIPPPFAAFAVAAGAPSFGDASSFYNAFVAIPVSVFTVSFSLQYLAARPRTEVVRFALTADIQPLVIDPGSSLEDSISLQSQAVAQAVDPGGAIPIGDLRRNSYFQTDRGAGSFECLLMMARAKLLARARAVKITFGTTFGAAAGLTCRMNVELHDRRLPGGVATGKIESYRLTADAHHGQRASVTIGCTIGNGNSFAAMPGKASYADGYNTGYEVIAGAQTALIPGQVNYETLDDFQIDDDGVDLFNMTAQQAIQSLIVTNGFDYQVSMVTQGTLLYGVAVPANPFAKLTEVATAVDLELVPLTGSFSTNFAPAVGLMAVPQTINLAAPELGL